MNINKKPLILIFLLAFSLVFIGSGCVDVDEALEKARREAAKEISHPEIELKSVPLELKRGEEVNVFSKALYFINPTDELYYNWAIDTGQSSVSFQPLVAGNEETGLVGGNNGFVFVPDVSKEINPYTDANMSLPSVPGLKNNYGIFYVVSGNVTLPWKKQSLDYSGCPGEEGGREPGADNAVVKRAPFVDTDNDGMDDNWERKYFPDIEDIADIKPDQDPDEDGYYADDFITLSLGEISYATVGDLTIEDPSPQQAAEVNFDLTSKCVQGKIFVVCYPGEATLNGYLTYQGEAEVEGGEGGGGGSGGSGGADDEDFWRRWWGSGGEGGEGGEGGTAKVNTPPERIPYPVEGSSDGEIYIKHSDVKLLDKPETLCGPGYILGNYSPIVPCGEAFISPEPRSEITETYILGAKLTENSQAQEVQAVVGKRTGGITLPTIAAPDVSDLDISGDGRFTNLEEYIWGTDPINQDSDGDGYNDEQDVIGLGQSEIKFTIPKDLPEDVEWYRVYSLATGISQKYKTLECSDSVYIAPSNAGGEDFKVFIISEEEEETKRKLEVELSAEDLYPSVGTPVEVLATPLYSGLDYNHLFYKWELTYKNSEGEFVGITDQATGIDPPDGNIFQKGKRVLTFTPTVSGIFRARAFIKERQIEEYELKIATGQLIIEAGSKIKLQFNSGDEPPALLTDDILKITAEPHFDCIEEEGVENRAAYCAYVWYLDGERQRSTSDSPQEFRLMVDKPGGSKYKLKVTVANVDGSETATKEVELFVYLPEVTIIPAPDTRIPTKPFVIAEVKTGDLITFEASPGPANSTFANDSLYYTWSIDKAEVFSEDFFRLDILAGLSESRKTLTLSVERKEGARYVIGLTADASGVSLAADASKGQRQIEVIDSSRFSIRQSAIIYDFERSEKVTIVDIPADTSIILAEGLSYSYQVSDKAKIKQSSTGRRAVDNLILEVVETPCKAVGEVCDTAEECCSGNCEEGTCQEEISLGFFGSMFAAVGFFLPESFKLALKIGLGGIGILVLIAVVFSVTSSSNFLGPKKKQ